MYSYYKSLMLIESEAFLLDNVWTWTGHIASLVAIYNRVIIKTGS